jgi:predicted DNA-binding protein
MMPAKGRAPKSSVVVRARVAPETAKMMRRLAKVAGKTTSDVIREAIELYERRERRRIATEKLIEMIPEKVPTKDEYAARFGKW